MDINVKKIDNLQNQNTLSSQSAEQAPEEIVLFASSSSEAPSPDGNIRQTPLNDYRGDIDGKDFSLKRRKNTIQSGYQIIGNIGNKKVNIEERNSLMSMSNKKTFKGNIGENRIEMQSKEVVSVTNKKVYSGTYNGKKFSIEYSDEHLILNDGDRVMNGTYDGQKVNAKYDYKRFGFYDKIENKAMPEGFEDIAVVIMTIDNDQKSKEN